MQTESRRGEGMSNHRREAVGRCWFFTVVTLRRTPLFDHPETIALLQRGIAECRARYPFEVDGWVTLPDHIHAIWRLPKGDRDYVRRWGMIKALFTQRYRDDGRSPWQKRFWAHRIDSEDDWRHHIDYLHIDPVQHGYVASPAEWHASTFHRYRRRGDYPDGWGGEMVLPRGVGRE